MSTQTRLPTATSATVSIALADQVLDIEVSFGPTTTVGHLVNRLENDWPGRWRQGVWIDGGRFAPERYLVDTPLTDGAMLSPTEPATVENAVGQLVAVAGADAGRVIRLRVGTYPAGGVLDGSLIMPDGEHLLIGGRRITIGEVFSNRQTAWRFERIPTAGSQAPGLFNRPPRVHPSSPEDPPPIPQPDEPTTTGSVLRWTMIVGPLVMGATMILIFKRPSFAIFMALGPLMALMNWIDAKRRGRKTDRIAALGHRAALTATVTKYRRWLSDRQTESNHQHPDLATVLSWPSSRSKRLWERRPGDADFGMTLVGYAPFEMYLPAGDLDATVIDLFSKHLPTTVLPIVANLSPGRVIGIVGERQESVALARAMIVQLAIHQGPADLTVRICAAPSLATAWAWTSLLPHTRTDSGSQPVHVTGQATENALNGDPALLLIDHLYEPRFSGLVREFAERSGTCIVIADEAMHLPAAVDQLITVGQTSINLELKLNPSSVTGTGIFPAADVCASAARSFASITDPETSSGTSLIPGRVDLLDLLGFETLDEDHVLKRWSDHPRRIAAPIGLSSDGIVELDIVRDGPHGLLAGTTGAGKSELLRTLVASLAANVSPEQLNFVLIDYKGGSAFDACADLPHVVGVVTDLDDHLAARAMTCLEAELGYREQILRAVGASDLDAYQRLAAQTPLSRLYLVVDEFAAMASDLPEFMDALVDIAARGRSLGVHLMLATQRPAGVVKDTIRANTNLRIALRVQTAADSRDVLDDGAAALLPRSTPGRGYVRFGPSDLTSFQAALVTGRSSAETADRLEITQIGLSGRDTAGPDRSDDDHPTDLDRLVRIIGSAAHQAGLARPRTPWPPSLPDTLALSELRNVPGAFGLIDEPDQQRQSPYVWDRSKGHIVFYGMPGTGPELAAESAVAALHASDGEVITYVLRFGTHDYAAIDKMSGVTPVIRPDDTERQHRLLRQLGKDLSLRRNSGAAGQPDKVLVVDDVEAWLHSLEAFHLTPLLDTATEILTKGHQCGIHVIATAFSTTSLRTKLAVGFTERLAFTLADRTQYAGLGIRLRTIPPLGVGRAINANTGQTVQIATDHSGVAFPDRPPQAPIPIMPNHVTDLETLADVLTRPWTIPLGIGEHRLGEVGVQLDEGDHLLIIGPARSGKTNALAVIAQQAHAADPDLQLVAITPRRSVLRDMASFKYVVDNPALVPGLATALLSAEEPVLVLVDDAEHVDGLDALLKARQPFVTVVAAIRSSESVRLYTHWTRRLRDSGTVLLLQTDNADLAGMKLPKGTNLTIPGRGFLCSQGSAEAIQVAWQPAVQPDSLPH